MSILKPLGTAAVLTAISFTPVQAQAVMQEPAYCAQFYPGANCQWQPLRPELSALWRPELGTVVER
jgi:hypothetical protein